jgi:PKD domain
VRSSTSATWLMRRLALLVALASILGALVLGAGDAQAIVVDMNQIGHSTVSFNSASRLDYTGVSMLPGTEDNLAGPAVLVPRVTSSGPCHDPALPPDLILRPGGLCWHGGPVVHRNETFAFTWDSGRAYWQTTRNYMEQFLGDVADGSGTFTSPYAITGGYSNASGRAANSALYGGRCIDFGHAGGSACKFGSINGSGPGHGYPGSGGCLASGTSYGSATNVACLTDVQIQDEIKTMVQQTVMLGRVAKGYTPIVVILTPTGVEDCLDAGGTVCSANSNALAQFCSYHSQVEVGGADVAYVVQPWTPYTSCDEPDVPDLPTNPTPQEVAVDAGRRLASPLARSTLGAIVNPDLNAWFALDGGEIGDNGCLPAPKNSEADKVTVGNSTQNPYWIQREFDNSGLIQSDPNSPECAPGVMLAPAFVVPSSVNPGDVVDFDGSGTASSMVVPKTGYRWSFGDGTSSIGPSVTHAYKAAGTYSVKLTVTDRGGNVASLVERIAVLGKTPTGPGGGGAGKHPLKAQLLVLPQGLGAALRGGVRVRVTSNKAADAIASLLITRRAAKRAHLRPGRGSSFTIGRGTFSGVRVGTMTLHLRVSHKIAVKLRQVRHLAITVRVTLFAAGGQRRTVTAAARY